MRTSFPTRCRAFTIVELLVVVAIIAILIALLMPVLSGARRQALRVQCRSNLQQVGNAVVMYVNDHRGRVPIAKKDRFSSAQPASIGSIT